MPNIGCIVNMRTATKLYGLPKTNGTNRIAILLTKQTHGTFCNGFFFWDVSFFNQWQFLSDSGIYKIFYIGQLFWSQFRKMGKVETQSLSVHSAPFLLHMGTQNFPQGLVQ